MTYLDIFINNLLEDKQFAYKLFKNWNSDIIIINTNNNIEFKTDLYTYNDKYEDELLNYCENFKTYINNLIKNNIDYKYIKNGCFKQIENKLSLYKQLDINDIIILNTYWLLNEIKDDLDIINYFINQNEIEVKWN